jgi:hypothetical protein
LIGSTAKGDFNTAFVFQHRHRNFNATTNIECKGRLSAAAAPSAESIPSSFHPSPSKSVGAYRSSVEFRDTRPGAAGILDGVFFEVVPLYLFLCCESIQVRVIEFTMGSQ